MPKRNKPNYTGILKKPIRLLDIDPLSSWDEFCSQYEPQYIARLTALYDHYGLKFKEPGNHFLLALRLAADHVEGFKITYKGRGSPKKWKGLDGYALWASVQALTLQGHTVNNAVRLLTKPGKPYENEKAPSLSVRYYEVCRDNPQVQHLKKIETEIKRMDELIEKIQAALSTGNKPE